LLRTDNRTAQSNQSMLRTANLNHKIISLCCVPVTGDHEITGNVAIYLVAIQASGFLNTKKQFYHLVA